MKKIYSILFIVLIILTGCATKKNSWHTDFPDTKKQAIDEKKDLLLYFSGSDWNDQCKSIKQWFFTKEFIDRFSKDYVLSVVDIPKNNDALSEKTLKENHILFTKYEVTEVPFLILQTFEGDVYFAKIIPPEVNTVDSFSAFIAQSLPERQKIIAARNTIRKAEGTEKALAIDDFLQIVYASSSPRYDSLRTQVIEADPNNQTGLRGKYLFQIANIKAEAFIRVNDLISAGDAYKEAAESEFLTAEQKQSLWYQAAYTYAVSEKIATGEIIDYLRKAIAVYPQGERVNQIKQVIKKLLNTKSN